MKRIGLPISAAIILVIAFFLYQNTKKDDASPNPLPLPENLEIPLTIPEGFSIEVFADNLPGARVMVFDGFKNMWLSQTSEGKISLLEIANGKVTNKGPVLKNLKNPHGLAFDPQSNGFGLYYAEEDKISKIPTYSDGGPTKLIDLPSGGGHYTRTLGFGPDNKLYVSIGSSCNVCDESDDRRAKIFTLDREGKNFTEFARGLRNTVFFVWHPETKQMWGTDMGRDLLGDDIPPDEINILSEGGNFGWPICYGKNIHDTTFDKKTYIRNPCMEPFEKPSVIDLQAHSAPLGLAFIPKNAGWPAAYENDLIVAYHGSWNRSVPTGYKLVRHKFSSTGTYEGVEDFVTGWIDSGDVLGRPAGVVIGPDNNLYVSDDETGTIYRIKPPVR